MRILSENDMDVAVVSLPLMLDEAVFERAGNGAGVMRYSSVAAAMVENFVGRRYKRTVRRGKG
jgi:hypothetical protein